MTSAPLTVERDFETSDSNGGKPRALVESEELQQAHYDEIAPDYESHYGDPCSLEYRRRFIYEPMFDGINLSGIQVLDAMCGCGQTTEYLLSRGASVTGLDISQGVIESFKARWTTTQALQRSLLDSGLPSNSFDCVVVVGGLHHMHPNVTAAVSEIHRLLKTGGHFCFMEPHLGSFPDVVRRIWYKHDRFFLDNEAAIDIELLKEEFVSRFEFRNLRYLGNLAFLLVLNSLIFRIPVNAKPHYSGALMKVEPLINKVQGKLTSCFVIAQWQKK